MNDMDHSAASTAEIPAPGGMNGGPAPAAWGGLAIHPLVGALARTRGWWRVEPVPAREWDGALQLRECLMLAISLVALLVCLPRVNFLLLLTSALVVYGVGEVQLPRARKLALVVAFVGIFVYVNHLFPRPAIRYVLWGQRAIEAFFILRCVDYALSRHVGTNGLSFADRFGRFLLWIFFLPTVFAGPVVTYRDFYRSYHPEIANWDQIVLADAVKIAWGLVKFAAVTPVLRQLSATLAAIPAPGVAGGAPTLVAQMDTRVLVATCLALDLIAFYLMFSGFTDVAIGLSRLLGFNLYENFDNPLLSTSPLRYWKTSNISTYRWLMTYVFFPYWGHTQVTAKVLTTFLVSALWHCTIVPFGRWEGMLQIGAAFAIFGCVVAAAIRLCRGGGGSQPAPAVRGRWLGGLAWSGKVVVTFCFIALIHKLFWNGLTGRPIEDAVRTYKDLFLGPR